MIVAGVGGGRWDPIRFVQTEAAALDTALVH